MKTTCKARRPRYKKSAVVSRALMKLKLLKHEEFSEPEGSVSLILLSNNHVYLVYPGDVYRVTRGGFDETAAAMRVPDQVIHMERISRI